MKVLYESELMKNQKQAQLLSPSGSFQIIQTSAGYALFFFIGADGAFYAAREAPATATGWTRLELSVSIARDHPDTPIVVKSFELCQNPKTLLFDIALVVTIKGSDHLYMSQSNSSSADTWNGDILWQSLPFDAEGEDTPDQLVIADVFMMNTPGPNGNVQNYFVDIQRAPFNSLQLLDRYYITPESFYCWARHALAVELRVGSIKSCPGNRHGDLVPGIYTLGAVGGPIGTEKPDAAPPEKVQLIYTPQKNPFNTKLAPSPSRLTLPDGCTISSTCIASVPNSQGETMLFLSGVDGLYLFAPNNQHNGALGKKLVGRTETFRNVKRLSAVTLNSTTTIWALNAVGEMFYFSCAAGKEDQPEAWTTSCPILVQVNHFSGFVNVDNASNVVFAQHHGHNLEQLIQDPATSSWTTRTILLPTEDTGKVFEYQTSTTRIITADDLGRAAPDTTVTISSSTYTSFFVNNVYYTLSPSKPLTFVSDEVGEITIVLESDSLVIAPFTVAIPGTVTEAVTVDPLVKAKAKLLDIKDGDSLAKIEITLEDGTKKSLLPSTVSPKQRTEAAKTLVQLGQVSQELDPTSGKKKRGDPGEPPQLDFAIDFSDPEFTYYEGQEKVSDLLNNKRKKRSVEDVEFFGDLADSITSKIGDLLRAFSYYAGKVGLFAVQQVKGAYEFVVQMGSSFYRAVVDTAQAVVGVMQLVFEKLKVAFNDLVSWLGFIFDWQDILRTQAAIKGVYKLWVAHVLGSVDSLKTTADTMLDGLADRIANLGNVKPVGRSTTGMLDDPKSQSTHSGSPQTNWGTYHFKNGADVAKANYTPSANISSECDSLMDKLKESADREVDDVHAAIQTFKSEVADNLSTLDPVDAITKTLALCSVVLVKTAKNILHAILDIIQAILKAVLESVDTPIEIPVITWLYEKATGKKGMSILDLFCLICAIPSTIIYKLATGRAPCPDDKVATELLRLENLVSLKTELVPRSLASDNDPTRTTRITDEAKAEHKGMPEETKNIIVSIANICTLPGWGMVMWVTRTRQSAVMTWTKSAFEFLADIIFDLPCYAWSITEMFGDKMDWPYHLNLGISTINFILRAIKTRTPSKVRWAVLDASLAIVFLVADIGYFARLDKSMTSDKFALAAEALESTSIFLDVLVAVADSSTNPGAKVVGKIILGLEIASQVGYVLCSIQTGVRTGSET
ncbi:uncharacterized protein N7496_004415 [Penicillium cataractarum]|uniref:Uncharacterized protein n=1 Tax=Penicillium cataractarum TaxID=2100454 RepID=A0A9W9VHD0_9EURO|nr:uncharacterized protein N7496_004415 [Penicillium cataractarum]KAJ5381987.1 hypothetical protein N7496_004415 [Penicillium cataractarum]